MKKPEKIDEETRKALMEDNRECGNVQIPETIDGQIQAAPIKFASRNLLPGDSSQHYLDLANCQDLRSKLISVLHDLDNMICISEEGNWFSDEQYLQHLKEVNEIVDGCVITFTVI